MQQQQHLQRTVPDKPHNSLMHHNFGTMSNGVVSQRAHKRLVNVYITFTITFRIGSECPFIKRLVLVKTFS